MKTLHNAWRSVTGRDLYLLRAAFVHDLEREPPEAFDVRSLPFAPYAKLLRAEFNGVVRPFVAVGLEDRLHEKRILECGGTGAIHRANALFKPVLTEATAMDYLHLFMVFVNMRTEIPINIVIDPVETGGKHVRPIAMERDDESFKATLTMSRAGMLFEADMIVYDNGMVDMDDDQRIGDASFNPLPRFPYL